MEPLDALGSAGLRRTLLFVRAEGRPVTAADVARELAVSRSAARWRLERLAEAGMLVTAFERRSGRTGPGAGRPAKTYAAAPELTATEFPPRRYEALFPLLLDALPRRGRTSRLVQVGLAFGSDVARAARVRKAATLPAALRRICRGLGRIGFHARVASITATEAVIVSATCPLRPLVAADPTACAIDEGMWRGLIASAVGGDGVAGVRCRAEGCLDVDAPCRIVVTLAG